MNGNSGKMRCLPGVSHLAQIYVVVLTDALKEKSKGKRINPTTLATYQNRDSHLLVPPLPVLHEKVGTPPPPPPLLLILESPTFESPAKIHLPATDVERLPPLADLAARLPLPSQMAPLQR